MGEVYRARDPRLGRDVAIKVLPAGLTSDPERLHRFEQEARAAAALNHPNILAVHDIGQDHGAPYIVSELLEGETLRERLGGGPLPLRKAVEFAIQIAHGLAAAHEKGIVHRDLKPENIFITANERVKLLDFGLAKLTQPDGGLTVTSLPTAAPIQTQAGMVLGTLGYMSPEQVRGLASDHRADIFAFGAVLYEMLSGTRAFRGDTTADTMTAILKDDPPELPIVERHIPPALGRIVERCLDKAVAARFYSMHDLAIALEAISSFSSTASNVGVQMPVAVGRRRWALGAAGIAIVAAIGAAAFGAGRRASMDAGAPTQGATFHLLSYRTQAIFRAAFVPDGRTIVFSATASGTRPQLYELSPEYPEPRALGSPGLHLLSVSSKGELAVLTGATYINHRLFNGTLARMPLGGSAPREVLEGVREADWDPEGAGLAIIREVSGKDRLEYPIGKVLYEVSGYLSDLRFSPAGDRIAFFEHPIRFDDRGEVVVVDLAGQSRVLSKGYAAEEGLAWSPDGKEVLFSASVSAYENFMVYGADLSGRVRVALPSAGGITLHDVSRDGRWLTTRDAITVDMLAKGPSSEVERNLSWLALSFPIDLSPDGQTLLFREEGGAVGLNYAVCIRKTDGSGVIQLGEGAPQGLSPDGKWALVVVPTSPDRLMLYPTGPGEPRRIDRGELEHYENARWFPDGRQLLVCGNESRRASRCYVRPVEGGPLKPVTPPEGFGRGRLSPDAKTLLARTPQGDWWVFMLDGTREPQRVAALTGDDRVTGWDADGRSVLVFRSLVSEPARVERLELATGRRTLVRVLTPPDTGGITAITGVIVSRDGTSYAYSVNQFKSQLFMVEGAR
jgi:Tol biopolymer transport system component